jgi:hypothetical protein
MRMGSQMPAPPFPIEDLLALADWLGRLARHFGPGGADVEDAVLKEALARLRAALDARYRSEPARWALLLAPMWEGQPIVAAAWKGAVIVAMPKKTLGLVALLALLGAGGWWLSPAKPGPPAPPATAGPPARPPRPPRFVRPVAVPSGAVQIDDSAAGTVEGTVVSAGSGEGIPGAELLFSFGDAALAARTDGQGRFRFSPSDPGLYLLTRVSAEAYSAFSPEWGDSPISFVLRKRERFAGVRLALQPQQACRGRVVDQRNQPVANASVSTFVVDRGLGTESRTQSDAEGIFQFLALPGIVIEAREGRRAGSQQLGFPGTPCSVAVRLGPPRDVQRMAISGRLERAAAGHHGRVLGGLEMKAAEDLGPLAVDLAAAKEGESSRLELVGIGAALAAKEGAIVLGKLAPEGGAARAGLSPGDQILAIDDRPVAEYGGLAGAVQRIRGAEGTQVLFRVRRAADGKEADVRVTRALVRF